MSLEKPTLEQQARDFVKDKSTSLTFNFSETKDAVAYFNSADKATRRVFVTNHYIIKGTGF